MQPKTVFKKYSRWIDGLKPCADATGFEALSPAEFSEESRTQAPSGRLIKTCGHDRRARKRIGLSDAAERAAWDAHPGEREGAL